MPALQYARNQTIFAQGDDCGVSEPVFDAAVDPGKRRSTTL
jgi:hypothetical protein